MRRLHLALFAALIGLGTAPAFSATQATISGLVADSSGVPQIGAVVQLLGPDMSVIATAYTSSRGRFSFASVLPGKYAVKAMGYLRVTLEGELQGLDLHEHGIPAYPEYALYPAATPQVGPRGRPADRGHGRAAWPAGADRSLRSRG